MREYASEGERKLRKQKRERVSKREKGRGERESKGQRECEFTLLLLGRGIKYGGPPTSTKVCEPQIPAVKTNRTPKTYTHTQTHTHTTSSSSSKTHTTRNITQNSIVLP